MISSLEYLKDMGIKILRVYGNVIEEEKFPIPNKLKRIRQTAIHQVPKSLKRISLHHVIRNRRRSPYARELKKYDKLFARMKKKKKEVPDERIKEYLKVVLILLMKITHIAFCVVRETFCFWTIESSTLSCYGKVRLLLHLLASILLPYSAGAKVEWRGLTLLFCPQRFC